MMSLTRTLRILIIEDEAVIAMTAEDMIEHLGFVVAGHAATLAEALERVDSIDFDIALLDINLNGQMSTPVAQALQAAGKRFVYTTGYGNAGPQSGFADAIVVAKPYTVAMLEKAIAQAVAGSDRAS